MSSYRIFMSIGEVPHVKFKKWPFRPFEFKVQVLPPYLGRGRHGRGSEESVKAFVKRVLITHYNK